MSELEEREEHLKQQEKALDDRKTVLDDRETVLNGIEMALDDREKDLDVREENLETMAGVRENCHVKYCFRIYSRKDGHITQLNNLNKKDLGSKAKFCAAFYHVGNWSEDQRSCLDEGNCIVKSQPQTVVALVQFRDTYGGPVYEARYTNCYANKNHAENFFDCDIRHGVLTDMVEKESNHKGTITLYLTYQPCNKSCTRETKGTRPNQSCCDILERIYFDILQPKGIRLRIKITHALRLEEEPRNDQLRKNARDGIQKLIKSGITVSGMEKNDWEYLFSKIDDAEDRPEYDEPRRYLDSSIRETLTNIF